MKKFVALLLVIGLLLPVVSGIAYDIDLTALTDAELQTLVQDISREILSRKGYSVATPTPSLVDAVITTEVQLEITGGRLYTRYNVKTFQITVKNLSDDYSIDAFDFEIRAFNNYGEQLTAGLYTNIQQCTASSVNIKPGKSYSSRTDNNWHWSLYSFDEATEIQVSISRYHFSDGDTVIVPEEGRVWVTFDLE